MASSTPTRLIVSLCLAFSLSARAQPQDAVKVAVEGKRAFEAGEYATAIKKYEAAERLKPAAGLLFNLGQSHRFAGNAEKATAYFRAYLLTRPDPSSARAIEALIERLEAKRFVEIAAERLGVEKARLAVMQRQLELGLCTELQPQPIVSKWWFWTILGAAAVGIAVSISVAALMPGAN